MDNSPRKRPVGQTRKQKILVPLNTNHVTDFKDIFLLVVASGYCNYIDPAIEDGTLSALAVLAFLKTKKVYTKLMANAKQRFFRMTQKTLITTAATTLNSWVRAGDTAQRLAAIRSLQDQGDGSYDEMCDVLVTALTMVAKGRGSGGSNEYGFYPYGKKASEYVTHFKAVPFAWFAVSLAAMYPFVHESIDKWEPLLAKFSHPMTQMWPWPIVSRYLNFCSLFRSNGQALFEKYESLGGDYHELGPQPTVSKPTSVSPQKNLSDDLSDDDEDSMDQLFS